MELQVREDKLPSVVKALSSPTRRNILKLLRDHELSISQIAERIEISAANVSVQVSILEQADLIDVRYESGYHGITKLCTMRLDRVILHLGDDSG